jgi:carboxylesterase
MQPGAEPFSADGGPVGVLVLHGFTGSPASIRPWAEDLAADGLTVRAPLLPGHGGTWQDLSRTGWLDWYAEAERAFAELSSVCEQVFVAGISMGGCLAFRLAQTQGANTRGGKLSGLVVVNPSLAGDTKLIILAPALKYVVKSLSSSGGDIKKPGVEEKAVKRTPVASVATLPRMWRTTAAQLGEVTQPLLVFRSTVDHVVGPASMRVLMAALPGAQVRPLANSYHVATLDNDAPEIFDGTRSFIRQHSGGQHSGGQHSGGQHGSEKNSDEKRSVS